MSFSHADNSNDNSFHNFLSWVSFTIQITTGKGKQPFSFISSYFQPITNNQIFRCNFAWEMTTILFLITMLVITRLLLIEIYHLGELPFNWYVHFCWFNWWCKFLLRQFDKRKLCISSSIDYQPCIRSNQTNQVCLSPQDWLYWPIILPCKWSKRNFSDDFF